MMTIHKIMAISLMGHSAKNAKQATTPSMINGPYINSNIPPNMRISILKNLFNSNAIR